MSKSSKLLKLLSASAIVASGNFYALADCGLCGEHEHRTGTCPHFDYKGYGLSKGYTQKNLPENDFLGNLALADRKNADKFLSVPASSIISFATPKGDTSKSLDADVSVSLDNSDADTAISESDAREINEESSNRHNRGDVESMMKARVANEAEEKYMDPPANLSIYGGGMEAMEEALQRRGAEEARSTAYENRNNVKISDEAKDRSLQQTESREMERWQKKVDRARERKELKDMMADRVRKEKEIEREIRDIKAQSARRTARNIKRIKNEANREIHEEYHRAEDLQNLFKEEKSGADIMRESNAAAAKIQKARRRQLARRKAAQLKEEAERQGKIQEHREEAAAKKITDALRTNKERRQAERQAQIESDYELAKKLQEEEVNARVEADRKLAEKTQAEFNEEDARSRAERFTEEQRRLQEEERIARENALVEQQRIEEAQTEQTPVGEESLLASETQTTLSADDEVENEHWTLPQTTAWNFRGYNHGGKAYGHNAKMWARQLEDLSIRKVECILWLVSQEYNKLQRQGDYAKGAQMAEAISDVDGIFPYSGTNEGIMNVYRAWENTDTADFCKDLGRLNRDELDGVLYYVASRYMRLLMSENGRKAASEKFVDLAKAVFVYFGEDWEADDVEIVPENKDVVAAPQEPKNLGALVNKAAQSDKVIIETEAPETSIWNPPYRVYYAYCHYIPHNLRPTRRSLQYHSEPNLFRADLRNLTIRRLETVIYLANTSYRLDLQDGAVPVNQEVAKSVEDVDRVFPKVDEGEPNARVMNTYNALKNMVDKPNDNPVSRQPFQRGFSELSTHEKVTALGDMAVAYREMLRNGKRPASLAFVKWADEICKALNLDGFNNGKDSVHPELKFEEFENREGSVAGTANDDGYEAADNRPWEAPERFAYDFRDYTEGDGIKQFQDQVSNLTVRQQEALIYKTVSVYVEKLGEHRVCELHPELDRAIRAVRDRFTGYKGDRLMNVLRASRYADGFEKELRKMFEESGERAFRWVEKVLFAIVVEYTPKLNKGARPADDVFTNLVHWMFEVFGVHEKDGEVEVGAEANPAVPEVNREAQRFNTPFWQLPVYLPNKVGEDAFDWYDTDGWKEKMAYLNIRQLEVMLVEFAKVYKKYGLHGWMEGKMNAISEAYNRLDEEGGDSVQIAEFRSAMGRARGKGAFESDEGGQASADQEKIHEALEIVIGEYLRRLGTALPVTPEFERAVRGR